MALCTTRVVCSYFRCLQVLPAGKAEHVKHLQAATGGSGAKRAVAMVGDGINDSGAWGACQLFHSILLQQRWPVRWHSLPGQVPL